jgi:hypothetical protein
MAEERGWYKGKGVHWQTGEVASSIKLFQLNYLYAQNQTKQNLPMGLCSTM